MIQNYQNFSIFFSMKILSNTPHILLFQYYHKGVHNKKKKQKRKKKKQRNMQYLLLPDKSSKLNTTGKFPILLTIVMEAHTFSYSSLEALMMHTLVIGFTYLTAHTDPKVRILSKMKNSI